MSPFALEAGAGGRRVRERAFDRGRQRLGDEGDHWIWPASPADGRIVPWNRAAERILGYPARDILGRPCCDVFVGHDDHGNRLHVSPATVRNHVQNLFAKLGVHSRLEAVAYATRHRLL
ncbi:MAG TPA: LuxR C-terminal-related transcriptional regulator [Solirubrobacteraceae bacterium]|nr:LuxR C-terminal-related transcriptional regulator [Solirubrobacteraceae bacterium]